MLYRITLKDHTTKLLSTDQFAGIYRHADANDQRRLEQLRYFYPDAIDWEMIEADQ